MATTTTKVSEIVVTNEAGEQAKLSLADYKKHLLASNEVEDYKDEESGQVFPKDKVVSNIVKNLADGKELDPGLASAYSSLISVVEQDIATTIGEKEDKKKKAEEEKAKKEEEKAKKEAEEKAKEEQLTLTRGTLLESVNAGSDAAAKDFVSELQAFKDQLPEGVTIKQVGSGFGLDVAADATIEQIGSAMGYLMQKSETTSWIGNQLHFWVGDMVTVLVERGLFPNAKEASKYFSEMLNTKYGKSLTDKNIDAYKRMADRTPPELRNPRVDTTAYLAVSNMPILKKNDKEEVSDFKTRQEAYETERTAIQKQLAEGKITSRKEAKDLVDKALVKHGLKEAPSDEPKVTVSELLRDFYHLTTAKEQLLDVHKKGFAVYVDGEKTHELSAEEIETNLQEVQAQLNNIFYRDTKNEITLKDYVRGYKTETKNVTIGKDGDGKPITEPQEVKTKVYPRVFFQPEETPAEEGDQKEAK
jgi:hypothetical protein